VIGPAIGFAAHVSDCKPKIDEVMAGEHKRRVIKGLHERAGDYVCLAMAALT
jgi:hypothetical protein